MPTFMTQFAFEPDAWPALIERPERLAGRLVDALENKLGGRLVNLYFCFGLGQWDGVIVYEAPDDITATAVLVAAIARSSHVSASQTTKLLTREEFAAALRKASTVSYDGPPGPVADQPQNSQQTI